MGPIRQALLAVVLLAAVTMALANRQVVTVALWPEAVTEVAGFGPTLTLPLFAVVLGAVAVGLLGGFVWEWLRERGIRADARRSRRELAALRARRAAEAAPPRDDVLVLLERRKSG